MYLEKPETEMLDVCPLSSVLWRTLLFLSLLLLLLYIGIRWPV